MLVTAAIFSTVIPVLKITAHKMAEKMFLYWASGSPPCWRVMLALEEKGLSGYPNKLLSFEKKEHKSEELLKWNPRGQVPTFIHDNHAINESLAACDYLEKVFAGQGTKLLPDASNHVQLGLVLQRTTEVLNLQSKSGELFMYKWFTSPEKFDQAEFNKRLEAYMNEIEVWEKNISGVEGGENKYLTGQELTMADIVFFPNLAIGVRVGLQLGQKFPQLSRYYDLMVKRPSVQKTWPPHWRDSPAKIFFPQ